MDYDSHAAGQLSALAETTPDVLVTIDERSCIQFVNPAIEEILGYDPEDLLGEPLTEIMPTTLARRHDEAIGRYLSTGNQTLAWNGIELPGEHREGHEVPLSISFSEFTLDGERYFTGIMRDVSERRRRADRLERLTAFVQEIIEAETVEAVCERAIAAAEDVLDLPLAEVVLYDSEAARLQSRARTAATSDHVEDGGPLFRSERCLPWQAFVEDECLAYGDRSTESGIEAGETPLESAIAVPIGSHGVFVAGDTAPEALSGTDRRLARILASTVAAILDRLDRERTLEERTAELQAKHDQYRRVQRLNGVIRDITQVLLTATTREEIKQIVCDRLASSDPYRFVWFGEQDLATDAVVPVAWAGVEEGYLDAVEITADHNPSGQGPAGRAVRSGEPQIQNDLQSDPPFEPWRREAIKRGYRAAISVPVVYRDTLYGVVNLYASEPKVFTEMEESVLCELGEMVGYGLNAMERYDALVAEDSLELEFVIRDETHPLFDLLGEHGGTFRLESVGEREGATQRIFVTFEGVPLAAIETLFGAAGGVDLTVIRDRGEEVVVELTLPEDSIIGALLERGAIPTEIDGTPDAAYLTIRLSRSASVREFVELFEARYDDVELVARRESPEPVQTTAQFERAFADRLTDRQEEVLRTAYYAGFFEQPRESSARDVAAILDVSQPTVSRHLRSGEKALFSLLFDDA